MSVTSAENAANARRKANAVTAYDSNNDAPTPRLNFKHERLEQAREELLEAEAEEAKARNEYMAAIKATRRLKTEVLALEEQIKEDTEAAANELQRAAEAHQSAGRRCSHRRKRSSHRRKSHRRKTHRR